MRVRLIALVALMLVTPLSAQKAPAVKGPLAAAKTVKCSFPAYVAARWTPSGPDVLTGTQDFTFGIDSIDYKKARARVVGAQGAATPVSMLLTQTGMSVIEQTPIGNVIVTTVFSAGGDGTKMRAVHSRHLGDVEGMSTPSQAYGSCEVTQ